MNQTEWVLWYHPKKWKYILRILGLFIILVIGILVVTQKEYFSFSDFIVFNGWFGVVFGIAGIIFSALHLIPGAYFLKTDSKGILLCDFFKNKFFSWQNIENIGLVRFGNIIEISYVTILDANERPKKAYISVDYSVPIETILGQLLEYKDIYKKT